MYYSNKRLKPTTAFAVVRRKKTHMKQAQVERKNSRFIGAMFVFSNVCARAAPHQHELAKKYCV